MNPMKLRAFFGGTFDPVHHGHLQAARDVRDHLGVEDFRFLPAGDPPHRLHTHASSAQRLHMLQLALSHEPGMSIDERELHRDGPSWMSVTLQSLRRDHPEDSLLLVVGQDAVNGLDQWHEWRRIFPLAHLVVMSRPERPRTYSEELDAELSSRTILEPEGLHAEISGCVFYCPVTPRPISSTEVRNGAADPVALRQWVPEAVANYIEAQGLYR